MTYPEVATLNLEVHNTTPEELLKRFVKILESMGP